MMNHKNSLRVTTRLTAAIAAVSLLLLTAGCSTSTADGLASQFKSGNNKNYISGDGTALEIAQADRGKPVVWNGVTDAGSVLSSANLSGVVTVINFWYAGCAPCRAEAPDLEALYKEFLPNKVQFVGVNVRDTAGTAQAFDRTFGMTYPSILDNTTGSVVLAFTDVVSPQAVPTTLVVDRKGRVAARILGSIEKGTLKAMIQKVVTEK
jgi:thiol-disulfide isomerase/thioredoxin